MSTRPSALPYFAAASQIAAEVGLFPVQLIALGWYNLIYCSPLIALVMARLLLAQETSAAVFEKSRVAVDWAFARLLPPAMGIAALILIIDGLRRLWFL